MAGLNGTNSTDDGLTNMIEEYKAKEKEVAELFSEANNNYITYQMDSFSEIMQNSWDRLLRNVIFYTSILALLILLKYMLYALYFANSTITAIDNLAAVDDLFQIFKGWCNVSFPLTETEYKEWKVLK